MVLRPSREEFQNVLAEIIDGVRQALGGVRRVIHESALLDLFAEIERHNPTTTTTTVTVDTHIGDGGRGDGKESNMFDAGGPDEASINHDHELFQHLDDDVEMVVGGDHQVTKEPYMTTLAILDARCDVDAMERAIRKHIGESFASIMEDSMGMEVYLVGS